MKTSIYIENGLLQVVLTPETEIEKLAVGKLANLKSVEAFKGGFYACQGGWVRHQNYVSDSTIFVIREEKEE